VTTPDKVPLIYGTIYGDRLICGPTSVSNGKLSITEPIPVSTIDALKTREKRGKVIVADIESLNGNRFVPGFADRCRISGNDIWLIETVHTVDDVFDAFIGNADKMIVPFHTMKSEKAFAEILNISEDCIPLITCRDGKTMSRRTPEIIGAVRNLTDIGYRSIMVADTDGNVPDGIWDILNNGICEITAYSPLRRSDAVTNADRVALDLFPFTSTSYLQGRSQNPLPSMQPDPRSYHRSWRSPVPPPIPSLRCWTSISSRTLHF